MYGFKGKTSTSRDVGLHNGRALTLTVAIVFRLRKSMIACRSISGAMAVAMLLMIVSG